MAAAALAPEPLVSVNLDKLSGVLSDLYAKVKKNEEANAALREEVSAGRAQEEALAAKLAEVSAQDRSGKEDLARLQEQIDAMREQMVQQAQVNFQTHESMTQLGLRVSALEEAAAAAAGAGESQPDQGAQGAENDEEEDEKEVKMQYVLDRLQSIEADLQRFVARPEHERTAAQVSNQAVELDDLHERIDALEGRVIASAARSRRTTARGPVSTSSGPAEGDGADAASHTGSSGQLDGLEDRLDALEALFGRLGALERRMSKKADLSAVLDAKERVQALAAVVNRHHDGASRAVSSGHDEQQGQQQRQRPTSAAHYRGGLEDAGGGDLTARFAELRRALEEQVAACNETSESAMRVARENAARLDELDSAAANGSGGGVSVGGGSLRYATQVYCDKQFDNLQEQIQALNSGIKRKLAAEFKVFERDLQAYLDDQLAQQYAEMQHSVQQTDPTRTSIGKTHFRCLTCNSAVPAVEGPMTDALISAITELPQPHPPAHQHVQFGKYQVENGQELPVQGVHGQIYRGRESPKMIAAPRATTASSTSRVAPSQAMPALMASRNTGSPRNKRPISAPATRKQTPRVRITSTPKKRQQ